MSDIQARVAEVLAAHWFRVFYPGPGPRDVGCECGWRLPVDDNNKARHAAHVASVLAEAGVLTDRPEFVWAKHRKAELSRALAARDAALAELAEVKRAAIADRLTEGEDRG